jgi:hypothetical protein
MTKYSKFLILPCILMFVASCTNLDENLKSEITQDINIPGISRPGAGGPATDAINSAFAELRNSGTAYHSAYYSVQEISSDEQCIATKGGDWFDGGILIELHRHTYNATHGFITNAWNSSYGAINTCNELIANPALDAGQKAQVRALRAYFYMRLCDMFGRVKLITTPRVDAPQVSRLEVYKFVEKELLESIGITEVSPTMDLSRSPLGEAPSQYRMTRWAALGILAKLYLNAEVYSGTAEWNKAATAAGYIIDRGPYRICGANCKVTNLWRRPSVTSDPAELTGYAAVFAANNENNPENILTVEYDEARAGGMNFSQMNLHYSSQFTYNFQDQPWNGYATLEEFYNNYAQNDARRVASFLVGPQLDFGGSAVLDYASDDGNLVLDYTPKINELVPNSKREAGARAAKFSYKQFGRPDMDNDYPIVRLGEMYLIRAEGLARARSNWNDADVLTAANVIRQRAGVPAYTAGQLNADEFLKERGREMFVEGVRRTDLIRFGQFNKAWWEKPASPASRNLFPIPQSAINAPNSGLTQNPGY